MGSPSTSLCSEQPGAHWWSGDLDKGVCKDHRAGRASCRGRFTGGPLASGLPTA